MVQVRGKHKKSKKTLKNSQHDSQEPPKKVARSSKRWYKQVVEIVENTSTNTNTVGGGV